ncbi:ABC transporter permease [Actinoalloteichus hymeniacidonis]|uniref:ABC-type proline/glycine betaine transport system, permease component n=1 Tax=Actinoalloteichus hymeniacidonis TaxID=340345 RepID=A0AAC9N109_9PSEU|nr:ABC transporter permease subunit [Actinoalloteichus hymeniacidonis]AOS65401.1 ABC-type proline/glycine betaine transport system, permease component [Actinoalloteichus hymeniacidonis]MBB5906513.1 osmoprotectant transport system permease protein [Actinoalloteichus hymeniacidonis]
MIQGLFDWLGDPANWQGTTGVPIRLVEHLVYCAIAIGLAAAIAVPLGLYIGHTGRGGVFLVGIGNAMRALPTLGLVTFLYLVLGGTQTATVVGLVVLAVPPILAGTYAGVQDVDRRVVDAASGVGMTGWQRLWQVEFPNALPLLFGGLRNAVLQVVATATVAAYVGLGGLGRLLLDGIREPDYSQVLASALLVALLALILDAVLATVQWLVVPRGLRPAAKPHRRRRQATPTDGEPANAAVAGTRP